MGIINKILNQVNVLSIAFRDVDNFDTRLIKYKNGKLLSTTNNLDINIIETSKEQTPIIIMLSGYGVITKDCETNKDIISRVTSDKEHFSWNFDYQGHISFVRKEQVAVVLKKLKNSQNKIIKIECLSGGVNQEEIENRIAQICREDISVKNIIHPTTYSSRLAIMLFQKLKLPVLVLVLLILVANVFVSGNVSEIYAQNNLRLTALQKQHGQVSSITQQKQQVIANYNKYLSIKTAFVFDRIALVTPIQITLSELAIQPLARPFELNKYPKLQENKIYITGFTQDYESISEYIDNLENETFIKKLTLTSVEQDNKTGLFTFKINIDI
jgi:Tfp pilus assembly protein PilN